MDARIGWGGQDAEAAGRGNGTKLLESFEDDFGDSFCEERRYGIPDLLVLGGPVSFKEVIVGERLQPRGLSYSQAPALPWVKMDVIVPILHDVGRDCRRGLPFDLDLEPVRKLYRVAPKESLRICVVRNQVFRNIIKGRRNAINFRIRSIEEIPLEVRR